MVIQVLHYNKYPLINRDVYSIFESTYMDNSLKKMPNIYMHTSGEVGGRKIIFSGIGYFFPWFPYGIASALYKRANVMGCMLDDSSKRSIRAVQMTNQAARACASHPKRDRCIRSCRNHQDSAYETNRLSCPVCETIMFHDGGQLWEEEKNDTKVERTKRSNARQAVSTISGDAPNLIRQEHRKNSSSSTCFRHLAISWIVTPV